MAACETVECVVGPEWVAAMALAAGPAGAQVTPSFALPNTPM